MSAPAAQDDDDPRFTMGLLFDIFAVLKRHGYVPADSPTSTARAMVEVLHLTEAYEGKLGLMGERLHQAAEKLDEGDGSQ